MATNFTMPSTEDVLKDYQNNTENDKRLTSVNTQKTSAMDTLNSTYDDMINQTDALYKNQIAEVEKWGEKQQELQDQRTDFAIEQINQQKDQAKQDYTKEQSGAYVDWQKQSNEYGVNAEQKAAQGMTGTGYSESSQVNMYVAYQNRVATARESFNRAVLNYDNALKDAQLQNNAALAEIAYNTLQKTLELTLEGFQYKNTLIMEKTKMGMELDNNYWNRYQDVLNQINTENALAEDVRQYNTGLEFESEQARLEREFEKEQAKLESLNNSAIIGKTGGGGGGSSSKVNTKKYSASVQQKVASVIKEVDKVKNPVDMKSVLALGYGPISAAKLDSLEKQGLVTSYVSDGKRKFEKSPYAVKQANLFNIYQ